MKIKTAELSKESLVNIVDILRDEHVVREPLVVAFLRADLAKQYASIEKQQREVDKKLKVKRLSKRAYTTLLKKYNQLAVRGNKKIDRYRELDSET